VSRHVPALRRVPAQRLEDYALIGDCESAALVSRNGSIDWLCWPRFDSPACFAGILGGADYGRWWIGPSGRATRIERRYLTDTLIVETTFHTARASVALTDFMLVRDHHPTIVRIVRGIRGRLRMSLEMILRFDYGSRIPWVTSLPDGGLCAIAGPDRVVLRSSVPLVGEGFKTVANFSIRSGQRQTFTMTYSSAHVPAPKPANPLEALRHTERAWRRWIRRASDTGRYSPAVRRSLITLKALTYRPSGGIVAAPTTSLPERLGGERNWDYRFCWLRDATFTLQSMMNSGYYEESRAWRAWLLRAVAGDPEQAQILYGIDGERLVPEWEVPWLPGYGNSKPVRIGNAASDQFQLDMYGEVMDVLHQARCVMKSDDAQDWPLQLKLLEHFEKVWELPDRGIWEVRGPPRHFTYSKVMAWVALDRAIKSAEQFKLRGPLARWRALREKIYRQVWREGFNKRLGTFVQCYGSRDLDASVLLFPLVGFVAADDPRMISTIERIERELVVDGLVLRYRTRASVDALPKGEGAFLACSFWLVDNYVLRGERRKARELFERLLSLSNDVGLLSEEYDPRQRRFLGNFPQAFSHIALINSAHNLTRFGASTKQRSDRKA
jgi:GH15 family glucan-1,4-alpha-glucosidase